MASKRCLPTRFFKDADIMNVSKDAQLILVGLVLLADDEGRELAHPRLLSREIDYPPQQIEAALQELLENDLVVLYQAGKHCYYSLTRWSQWQSISSQKMTPSKYPAPPAAALVPIDIPLATRAAETNESGVHVAVNVSQQSPEFPRISQRNAGENRENPTQLNLSESNSSESKLIEDEGDAQPPPNILPFPAARADDAEAENDTNSSEQAVREATQQVAAILKLAVTDNLQRVVADYLDDPSLSLLGEADAAREWIEDPRRNRKHKQLTPAFFRCWLKREHEAVCRGYGPPGAFLRETAGGTSPAHVRTTRTPANGMGPPGMPGTKTAQQAENPYQAFVSARAQAVMRRSLSRQEEVRHEASP